MSSINVGAQSEDEVQAAVERAFSSDFVFRSPKKEAGSDEVTDVLVLFGDVGLVIESKSQAVNTSISVHDNSFKWAKKNLKKAGRQVAGAVRTLQTGRMPYAENSRQGRADFSTHEVKWLYGLIVLNHRSPPYSPFELVPRLKTTQVPLHILSLADFLELAWILNTPADLVTYLEDRSDVLQSKLRPLVHREQDVFKYWVDHLEDIYEHRARKNGWSTTRADSERYASELRKYLRDEVDDVQAGKLVDELIDRAHDVDPLLEPLDSAGQLIKSAPDSYIKVATELGMIPRVRRIALGRRFFRIVHRAGEERVERVYSSHSPTRSDCLLFLASPLPRCARNQRREQLYVKTRLFKHHHRVTKAIGIATEAGTSSGRSYDFVFFEGEHVEDEKLSRLAQQAFGEAISLLGDEPSEF